MSDDLMISYAQNAEDVVLWRALGHVRGGTYVDIGGFDPDEDSVTRVFYERGWRGIDVEPVPGFAAKFRDRRPGNEIVEAAVTDRDLSQVELHWFDETGLSTLVDGFAEQHQQSGFEHRTISVPALRLDTVLEQSALVQETIHFLKVDVEGAEDQVLRSFDLARWRPWVLVIEATEPNSTKPSHQAWEPQILEAGYTMTLFDGLSRFYVSPDHQELNAPLSYPACPLDWYVPSRQVKLERRVAEIDLDMQQRSEGERVARADALRWRNTAAAYWADAVAKVQTSEAQASQARLDGDRLGRQYQQTHAALQRVREERDQLRARGQKMRRRIEQMSTRIDRMGQRLAEGQAANETLARRVRRRLRRPRPASKSA